MTQRDAHTIAVLLFSGAPIFESSVPLSVFGVDRSDMGVPTHTVLPVAGEPGPLVTTAGLRLEAPYGLDALDGAGTVIVPTWRNPAQAPPAEALEALAQAHASGARVVGLCLGAFVLAAAGLLDGRPATTHWLYAPALAQEYPKVHVDLKSLFVDDGTILTSAGTASGIDCCLHILRRDHGSQVANVVARRMVVSPLRTGKQSQFIHRPVPERMEGDPLADVLAWAVEHLAEVSIDVLAAKAFMSRRTFQRRFHDMTGVSPHQWLLSQRILFVQQLLESTDLPVDAVAQRAGFTDAGALRPHFRRVVGVSPQMYRDSVRHRLRAARRTGAEVPRGWADPSGPDDEPSGDRNA
ncbi:helix-turn-helix domain-containing protein [Streptomyces sp. FZ201]|uniref:helix-turn-helix domain-containing protein n=1 Tax=Streptomyces sp. FZ201 TaxID=3057122 RepID=UPI0021C23407|nr:helix-turn-helix domain-containing protein [Streptomyces sp. FZ201]